MKRNYLVLTLMFLLTAGLCFAQDSGASAQQPPAASQDSQQRTDVGQPTDTNEPLFKGCLSGTEDNYVLTDQKSGEKFRLHSDKDINEHVGHMVEIRGTVKKEGADRANVSTKAERELDVADVKSVSGSCPASAK